MSPVSFFFKQKTAYEISECLVGSAGLERQLKRPGDFVQFMGSPVLLKTYKPVNGRKEFAGRLAGYDNGAVELDMGTAQPLRFEKQDIALVRLRVEF